MLDIRFIRENFEHVKEAIDKKGETIAIDNFLELDSKRRKMVSEVDKLKHRRNQVSEEIGRLKKEKKDAQSLISEMKTVSERIKTIDSEIQKIEKEVNNIIIKIPNIPHPSVPVGDESHNKEIKSWGEFPEFDFTPKDHLELGKELDIIDFPRASKIIGGGFPLYKGLGAQLERALINFMLDLHINKHGYTEIFPPFLANRDSMFGTGQLPKLEEDMYLCEVDDIFLIPTAEVPLTNIHRDEILDASDLPVYYTAYSACFRREAGSYGKDTRGFLRVHQFNKVEMVKIVLPETSYDELETLLKDAEEVLQLLELPYRVITLATGDLSFAAAKCYDIEIWAPAEKKFLEVSSCSNFEDFQARRIGIKFRRTKEAKSEFVHTLNGSGVATPRLLIALLETYQTDEGTVIVPEVLRKYMGGINIIK
ncbi:serine--tRNA ligase [candidate division KSB1 bacterium]